MSHANPQLIAVICGLFWGLVHWVLMTDTVIVYNDDFGYLRSIVETFRRGRPWTDDWLEPWSASLSVISAAVWKITGSFKLATHGVQAACVTVGFIGAAFVYIRRGFHGWSASLIAAGLFTAPTILWKNLEFTAFVLYLACFFQAVYAAERQRWLAFALWTCVAISSRQSALAWLALPAMEWLQCLRAPNRATLRSQAAPLAVLFLGLACYALCQLGMNRTHAQRVMTSAMWSSLQPESIVRWLSFSLFLTYAALGFGNLVIAVLANRFPRPTHPSGLSVLARFIAPVIVVGSFVALRNQFDLQYEHGLLSNTTGIVYLGVCTLLSVAGWTVVPICIDRSLLAGAFACAAITSIRGAVWDYYLVDAVLFAFLAARPFRAAVEVSLAGVQENSQNRPHTQWIHVVATVVLVGALTPFHVSFINASKRTLENFQAWLVLSERSLREGKIDVTELAYAPFGFTGWHLYPHFITHEGAGGAYIAGFLDYLRHGAVTLETRGANDARPLDRPESVIISEVFNVGWRERHRFILRRREPPPHAMVAADYRLQPFPLNDAEWRALVRFPSKPD